MNKFLVLIGMGCGIIYGSNYILSPQNINEWQYKDKNGMVLPWYTKPFLDELVTWDIANWDVFEWGGGHSTIWWAAHCKHVVSVDGNIDWVTAIDNTLRILNLNNVTLKLRIPDATCYNIGDGGENSAYVNSIDEDDKLYDCIIIDGECCRNTCATKVIKHLKPNGILILDNANQATIALNSEKTFNLFKQYQHYSFKQPNHVDWRTDYWIIQKD